MEIDTCIGCKHKGMGSSVCYSCIIHSDAVPSNYALKIREMKCLDCKHYAEGDVSAYRMCSVCMRAASRINFEPLGIDPKQEIKDSGDRREFETGAVRDMGEGKGRYDLLPWDAIHELAIHCEQGAKKYGERNIEKGLPVHSLIDSAIRHLSCYLRGEKDEPHLRAALWNVAFAIWTEKNKPEMQDIPMRK